MRPHEYFIFECHNEWFAEDADCRSVKNQGTNGVDRINEVGHAMSVSQSLTYKDLSNIVDDPQRWLMERLDGWLRQPHPTDDTVASISSIL